MKNTKRITNINDYSKEVDKIIASGKPVHEQLMEMLEMVGGKFVDVSSNKHDKSVQDFRLSDCCGAKVLVTSAIPDEGTRYWVCSNCLRPCDINPTVKESSTVQLTKSDSSKKRNSVKHKKFNLFETLKRLLRK